MSDRIEEIKARCEVATPGPWVIVVLGNTVKSLQVISHGVCAKICSGMSPKKRDAHFIANAREDIPFLLGEIDNLKMMLDAAVAGQEVLQKQWAADVAERDAAIADLTMIEHCGTCKHERECQLGTCDSGSYEWRRVQQ